MPVSVSISSAILRLSSPIEAASRSLREERSRSAISMEREKRRKSVWALRALRSAIAATATEMAATISAAMGNSVDSAATAPALCAREASSTLSRPSTTAPKKAPFRSIRTHPLANAAMAARFRPGSCATCAGPC